MSITKEQLAEMQERIEKSRYIPLPEKRAEPLKSGRKTREVNQLAILKDKSELSQKINIKPLSVNLAWQGKRFKTPEYTKYEQKVLRLLNSKLLPTPPYKLNIEYGFSNKASDIDNPTKLILDILQKKYKFDDKEIYELNLIKKIVKKGNEYFEFNLKSL